MKGIEQLNARHGDGTFILFHRPRVWCETERRWIGWERKRGKLEELNRFLNGEDCEHFVHAGTAPAEHPLCDHARRRHSTSTRQRTKTDRNDCASAEQSGAHAGSSATASAATPSFSRASVSRCHRRQHRVFRGYSRTRAEVIPIARRFPTFIRMYSAKRSITAKASMTFGLSTKSLRGRFPEQRLLSHDLIEGAHVGVGLATDVELFEQFPIRLYELQQTAAPLDPRRLADRFLDFPSGPGCSGITTRRRIH